MKWGIVTFRLLPNAQPIRLWHKDTDTQNVDVLVLPGGFSYGDYLRSGAIARFSPIMQAVERHAATGRPLIGICNGFQVLVEAGLLPGALLHNTQRRFICTDIHVRVEQTHSILTQNTSVGQVLRLPIAHGEGRYFAPQDDIKRLEDQGQVILRYCSAAGELTEDGNPNGSTNHIAGICNPAGNICGLMPHPERVMHPNMGHTDGRTLLESVAGRLNLLEV
jgi:phosphoribosylformylglycinamidine synthase